MRISHPVHRWLAGLLLSAASVVALAQAAKPNVVVLATGGTIASKEEGNGLSPALSGEELTRYVPEVADLATLDVKQAMNIDSTNMRPSDWLRVARTVVEWALECTTARVTAPASADTQA